MEIENEKYKERPGWGMEADTENETKHQMKKDKGEEYKPSEYEGAKK